MSIAVSRDIFPMNKLDNWLKKSSGNYFSSSSVFVVPYTLLYVMCTFRSGDYG